MKEFKVPQATFKIDLGNDMPGNTTIIQPAGLTWPDVVPVTWNYEADSLLGKATNIRMVEDHLEADIEWTPGTSMAPGLDSGQTMILPAYHVDELEVDRKIGRAHV